MPSGEKNIIELQMDGFWKERHKPIVGVMSERQKQEINLLKSSINLSAVFLIQDLVVWKNISMFYIILDCFNINIKNNIFLNKKILENNFCEIQP